ncbi:MAG: alkaline phosphatase D family protein [Planctomycetaceae bacterium]|nr:alkaline phosphatase D family protein [Planctomycetaceae bacterium]
MSSKRYGVDRRHFLKYLSALSAVPLLGQQVEGRVLQQPKFKDNPFQMGVASGDPSPTGAVLWTRLAPDPLHDGGMPEEFVKVRWQVAEDEQMTKVVKKGTAIATPQLGHSLHVEVDGLEPDRWYFYQFKAGSEVSPVGRTRTTPPWGTMPDSMRFAYTSCQHFEYGYFNGYDHMVKEELDLVLHLGDYIYEYGGRDKMPRKHLGNEIVSLDDYRNRYAQYRVDPQLQEAHRIFPWIVTWDDHEFDNNYANLVSEEEGISPEEFLYRRMNAYQAYYEVMPLRKATMPRGPNMKLYRKIRYGRLANFYVLDTRQYRSDQPNNDGNKELAGKVFDPQATMLGEKQEGWLMSNLLQTKSTWNVLAQQVMMARVNRGSGDQRAFSMDQWPGYEVSRNNLLRFFNDRKVPNPVVLTGDIHTNWVNDLRVDFDDPNSPVVGTEFVGTSMTSGGNGGQRIEVFEKAAAQNDFVKWYNAERGYVACTLTEDEWRTDFRVTPIVDQLGSEMATRGSFILEAGRPGAHPA